MVGWILGSVPVPGDTADDRNLALPHHKGCLRVLGFGGLGFRGLGFRVTHNKKYTRVPIV